jgi:hypothetical protein
MSSYRTEQGTTNAIVLAMALAFMLIGATVTVAQQGGPARMPGPAARESNREMDAYDRELNLLKNDAKAAKERRRNLFPQINEDFQRIQVIHNEIVRMVQADKGLDYNHLMDLTAEMKKRSNRLRINLALPEPEKRAEDSTMLKDAGVRGSVVALHDLIVSFVANPIFKNLGVFDAKLVSKASGDLRDIIQTSEDLKKTAEMLSKTAKQ